MAFSFTENDKNSHECLDFAQGKDTRDSYSARDVLHLWDKGNSPCQRSKETTFVEFRVPRQVFENSH